MNKKYLFILAGLLGTLLLASCAPAATIAPQPILRSINVDGVGQVTLVPDIAYINIGVRTEADDVTTALGNNSDLASAISDKLKSMGVDEKDIQTTSFNVYPMQQYDKDGQITKTTFVVENTVYITVRKLDQLGKMLDATVKAGANSIYGISFDVEDKAAATEQARELAIKAAQAKAQSIADVAGVKLGEIQSISVYSSGGITPYYNDKVGMGGAEMMSNTPMAAGTLIISANANLTYEIK